MRWSYFISKVIFLVLDFKGFDYDVRGVGRVFLSRRGGFCNRG